jgi:hypothetical protein
MKPRRVFSIVEIVLLFLTSIPYQAQAQQPVTQPNTASDSAQSDDHIRLSNLVAQARPRKRGGFALMPDSYVVDLSGPVFSIAPAAAGPNLTVMGRGRLEG